MGLDEVVRSFERCTAGGQFLDRFYTLFLASSDEVRHKFRDTDFSRQHAVLAESLHTILAAGDGPYAGIMRFHLERIAKRHSRGEMDIRPELYTLWLECLLQAVRESDPQYHDELGAAWRRSLAPCIAFLTERY